MHLGSVVEFGWLSHGPYEPLSDADIARRKVITTVPHFIFDRLQVIMRDDGLRPDFIAASLEIGSISDGRIDLVLQRASALRDFIQTENGTNLLAGYKRASNILKQAGGDADWTPDQAWGDGWESEEKALLTALNAAEPQATAAIEAEKFEDAMSALASLRAPIDAFFDNVMVNDEDASKRAFRLGLLARFRDAVHKVADFSKIEG